MTDGEYIDALIDAVGSGVSVTLHERLADLVEPQLPESVEWPRFEDGERVKRPAPKVLDADGVPIEVGDTVWATYDGRRHIVIAVCSDGSLHPEMLTNDGCMVEYEEGLWDFAKKVTHEQPDSWEKLEEDARKTACAYAPAPRNEDGLTTCDGCPFEKSESCGNEMMLDLVERAKKLAGIEESDRIRKLAEKEEA